VVLNLKGNDKLG